MTGRPDSCCRPATPLSSSCRQIRLIKRPHQNPSADPAVFSVERAASCSYVLGGSTVLLPVLFRSAWATADAVLAVHFHPAIKHIAPGACAVHALLGTQQTPTAGPPAGCRPLRYANLCHAAQCSRPSPISWWTALTKDTTACLLAAFASLALPSGHPRCANANKALLDSRTVT